MTDHCGVTDSLGQTARADIKLLIDRCFICQKYADIAASICNKAGKPVAAECGI